MMFKMNSKYKYHQLLFCMLFLSICLTGFSQKESVWVKITYAFKIENGQKTSQGVIIDQKTYLKNNKLIREIKLDSLTGEVNAYIVYFYDDKDRLSSQEEFSIQDSFMNGRKYIYDVQGRIGEMKYYLSESAKKPLLESREVYSYSNDTALASIRAYNLAKKKIYTVSYKYDPITKTNIIEKKYKSSPEGIKKSIKKLVLNNRGLVSKMHKTIIYKNGKLVNLSSDYTYTDNGQLASEKKYKEGQLEKEINNQYYANNNPLDTEIKNKDGNILSYNRFDYRTFLINLGSNTSILK